MDLEDMFARYFGTTDLATLEAGTYDAGIDRLRVDFGLERDAGRRFALWSLMHMLGVAPDLDIAFADVADREAARDFMDLVDDEGDRMTTS